MGLVKLATMAATEICRLESGKRQPGCRPKQAACPYFPSLREEEESGTQMLPCGWPRVWSCSEQKLLVTPEIPPTPRFWLRSPCPSPPPSLCHAQGLTAGTGPGRTCRWSPRRTCPSPCRAGRPRATPEPSPPGGR